jgi:hypothetical protein
MKALFNCTKRITKESTDFVWKEIELLGKDTVVYIASAFFSNSDLITRLIENGCEIRLIVRLSSGTSSSELRKIINNNKIAIRYYTSESFHPKMYIFGQNAAIVGSSNLTKSGVGTNQEANIEISSNDSVFEDIENMFQDYWSYAEVLTLDILNKFMSISDELEAAKRKFDSLIRKKIEEVNYPNIDRYEVNKKKDTIFKSDFKKRYQIFLKKHKQLEEIYIGKLGRISNLPTRIEIDRFLSWIRENKATKEVYLQMPKRNDEDLKSFIHKIKKEYFESDDNYIKLTEEKYFPKINSLFKDKETIDSLNEDDIYSALLVINAFISRERYFKGGAETMKKEFFIENEIGKVKEVIKYLLFGNDNYVERITNCIFDDKYKLKEFGPSCVKELYGLVNNNDIPICNERTFKSMQYLGFGNLG